MEIKKIDSSAGLATSSTNSYLERTRRNQFWVGGVEGQLKLKSLKVGVAGLGGMGSNIAEILVRLGVGCLHLADPDTIEQSNMNRQVIANKNTIGMTKLEASLEELRNIEELLEVKCFPEGITQENAKEFCEGLDLVINEIDVLHVKEQIYLLEAAREKNIPVYTTLVVGVGIHLYKYSAHSSFTPRDFLKKILDDEGIDSIVDTLGHPLPSYLQGEDLQDFKKEIKERGGIPIFGASTYLGQSLLVIRALADLGVIRAPVALPPTPCLPEFLVLDPLTLELKIAHIERNEEST